MASDRIQRNIERLLDAVDEAIAQRDWGAVRDCAQDILALDPENCEALAFLAAADRALGSITPAPPESFVSGAGISAKPPDQPTSFANGRYEN